MQFMHKFIQRLLDNRAKHAPHTDWHHHNNDPIRDDAHKNENKNENKKYSQMRLNTNHN